MALVLHYFEDGPRRCSAQVHLARANCFGLLDSTGNGFFPLICRLGACSSVIQAIDRKRVALLKLLLQPALSGFFNPLQLSVLFRDYSNA